MLVFDTWPPEAGKVHFAADSLRLVSEYPSVSNVSSRPKTARLIVSLLANNGTDEPNILQIGQSLSGEIPDQDRRSVFLRQFTAALSTIEIGDHV